MTKQELLKIVESLPDEIPSEMLDGVAAELEKVRFKATMDRGLRQAERGEATPQDEFVARFKGRFQA